VSRIEARDYPHLTVSFRAVDDSGRYMAALTAREMVVTVGQRPIVVDSIRTISASEEHPYIELVLDVSGSMRSVLPVLQAEVQELTRRLGPSVPIGIVLAGATAVDRLPPNGNVDSVRAALPERADAKRTAIWDAILMAVTQRRDVTRGRRIVIAVSDGRDNASHVKLDSLEGVLRNAGVSVFTIAFGERIDSLALARLATSSHGASFVASPGAISAALAHIGSAIAAEHVMSLTIPPSAPAGWDTLRIALQSGGAVASGAWAGPILLDPAATAAVAAPDDQLMSWLAGWSVMGLVGALACFARQANRSFRIAALFAAIWISGAICLVTATRLLA
jgi:hypothetical protein